MIFSQKWKQLCLNLLPSSRNIIVSHSKSWQLVQCFFEQSPCKWFFQIPKLAGLKVSEMKKKCILKWNLFTILNGTPIILCFAIKGTTNRGLTLMCAKGQLISKGLFDVIVSAKKTMNFFLRISVLASKKRSDQKN